MAEFMVVFFLAFAVMTAAMNFDERPTNVYVKNMIGLTVMAIIDSFAHVEQAVLNPNVCLLFAFSKRMSIPKGWWPVK